MDNNVLTFKNVFITYFTFIFFWINSIFLRNLVLRNEFFYPKHRNDLVFMVVFITPIISVIIFNSVLYNGWRHLYYIYAPFLLISLKFLIIITKEISFQKRFLLELIIIGFFVLNIFSVAYFMIKYHPFQYAYFNAIAGNVNKNFKKDYYGLSYRQALENILNRSSLKDVLINSPSYSAQINSMILPYQNFKRLKFVDVDDANYLIIDSNDIKSENMAAYYLLFPNELYRIQINDYTIITVYGRK